jgi:hypothetical protein
MDTAVAGDVARRLHGAERTRFGTLVVQHLQQATARGR